MPGATTANAATKSSFVEASSSSTGAVQASPQLGIPDDVVGQLQFIIAGGISVVVTIVVAKYCADQKTFYRDLSEIPLHAGKSRLCRTVCPAVIDQMKRMYDNGENVVVNGENNNNNNGNRKLSYAAADLLDDPTTEELESVVRLVHNCRQRLAYIQELKNKKNEKQPIEGGAEEAADDSLVEIPSPGVPPNYLGLQVDSSIEHTGGSNENETIY